MTDGCSQALTSGLLVFDRSIKRLNLLGSVLAAVFLVLVVIIGVADVIGANVLRAPVPSALEISQNGMVFIIFGGMAFAVQRGSHVAVDLFLEKMPAALRRVSAGLALVISIVVFGFIGWRGGVAALESIAINEQASGYLRFPVYPAKVALCLGCALAVLECLRQLVRLCIGRPDPSERRASEEPGL